jgi:type IV secretory pathway TraG/TraD family ATPase VirD4
MIGGGKGPFGGVYWAHRLAWQLTKKSAGAGRFAAQRAQHARAQRAVADGVLGPGDAAPPPGVGDFYDYRGIASASEVSHLDLRGLGPSGFRLGWLVDPKRGAQFEVGLPFEALRRHAAVIGPAGSGKTAGAIIPWIVSALRGGHSVVALDVKGDLLDDILGYASRGGPIGVPVGKWDYTDPNRSVRWDWLSELKQDEQIEAAVTAILGREKTQSNADPFFYRRDWQLLRGLLRLATTTLMPGKAKPSLLGRALANRDLIQGTVLALPNAPGATDLMATVGHRDASDYQKSASGVATALAKLDSPAIDQVSEPDPKRAFTFDMLFSRPTLLVVAAPLSGGDTARFLSTIFLNLLVRRLFGQFGKTATHVFLVIDEAPRLVDRFNFEEVLSIARSAGVSVVIAAQDIGQFKDENERSTILTNCATYVSLAGASPMSVKFLMERLGKHRVEVRDISHNSAGGVLGSYGRGHRIEAQDVLAEREIAHPPFGSRCAIAHVQAAELGITAKPLLLDMTF